MPESLLHSISFSLAKRAYCHNLGACSCTPEIQIMKKLSFSILILIILTPFLTAQKAISLEDIWRDYTFYPKSVPGFRVLNDGQHYTRLEDNAINQYSLATGEQTTTIFQADMVRGEGSFSGKSMDTLFLMMNSAFSFKQTMSKFIDGQAGVLFMCGIARILQSLLCQRMGSNSMLRLALMHRK